MRLPQRWWRSEMSHLQSLSRRAFIVGSAALAGGIAFGSYGNAEPAATTANGNPMAAGIGQGVGSVQPIVIAEEMDLDPGQFEIRFAVPSPAYFNTGLADEYAPFLAADQSPTAEEARAAA